MNEHSPTNSGCSSSGDSAASYRQTTEDFIRCLENAFWHFGGVPQTLIIDYVPELLNAEKNAEFGWGAAWAGASVGMAENRRGAGGSDGVYAEEESRIVASRNGFSGSVSRLEPPGLASTLDNLESLAGLAHV